MANWSLAAWSVRAGLDVADSSVWPRRGVCPPPAGAYSQSKHCCLRRQRLTKGDEGPACRAHLLPRPPVRRRSSPRTHFPRRGQPGRYPALVCPPQYSADCRTPYQAILPPKAGSHAALERLAQLPPLKLNIEAPNAVEAAIGKESQSSTKPYPPFLPGAGLTRRMLGALADVPSGAIAAWVVEGDNRGDARTLADLSLKVLGISGSHELLVH